MKTFEEYEALATRVPVSLRNNRDRIQLPVLGLQEESGKVGSLLNSVFASGKLNLTQEQTREIKERLANILWYMTILCEETGVTLEELAAHSAVQLQEKLDQFDSEQR